MEDPLARPRPRRGPTTHAAGSEVPGAAGAGAGVAAVLAVVACAGLALAACSATGTSPGGAHRDPSRPWSGVSGTPPPIRVDGPGWAGSALDGPVPGPGTCRAHTATGGEALPDRRCTPGAVDDRVHQGNLAATVCRPGWARRRRPPEAVTEPFKVADLRAYGEVGPIGSYELDHLVPLELGGASDTRNLWPEPDDRPAPGVANSKDPVEQALHDLVCAAVDGRPHLLLRRAQVLIATDWTTAVAAARTELVGGDDGR